jgi:hypothetical protein
MERPKSGGTKIYLSETHNDDIPSEPGSNELLLDRILAIPTPSPCSTFRSFPSFRSFRSFPLIIVGADGADGADPCPKLPK